MLQIYFSGYAPPEFVDMGKITKKFDVFSLGVIIIKILTGSDGYSTYSDMSSSQDFIDLVWEVFFSYEDYNVHFLVVLARNVFIVRYGVY